MSETTTDKNHPDLKRGVDTEEADQSKVYLVLSEEEKAKGFVRPVRTEYVHDTCGAATKMGVSIAETYARDPKFYGSTYCVKCRKTGRPIKGPHLVEKNNRVNQMLLININLEG